MSLVSKSIELTEKQLPHVIGRDKTTLAYLKRQFSVDIEILDTTLSITGEEKQIDSCISKIKKLIIQSYVPYPHPKKAIVHYDTALKYSVKEQEKGLYTILSDGTAQFDIKQICDSVSKYEGIPTIYFGKKTFYAIVPEMLDQSDSKLFDSYTKQRGVRTSFVATVDQSFIDTLSLPEAISEETTASISFVDTDKGLIECEVKLEGDKIEPIRYKLSHEKVLFYDVVVSSDRTVRVRVDDIKYGSDTDFMKYLSYSQGRISVLESHTVLFDSLRLKKKSLHKFEGFSVEVIKIKDTIEVRLCDISDMEAALEYSLKHH